MPDKIKLPQLEIIYRDPFILKSLYRFQHDWFIDNQYTDEDGGDKRLEKTYWELRHKDVRHYRLWWRGFKPPLDQTSDFAMMHMHVDWLCLGIQQIEIMHQGKKIKAQSGEVTYRINPYVEIDYKDYFQSNFILRAFEDVFKTRWMKLNHEGLKAEIKRDAWRLMNSTKKFFEVWTDRPTEEGIHKKFDRS